MRDIRFCLSYPLHDEKLLASIGKLGIIEPIILLEPAPFTVVTGFKRLVAAKRLGLKEVPAVTQALSEKQALLLAVHDNMHRGLNIVEKAHTIERMVTQGFSRDEFDTVMGLFSLSPHEKVSTQLISIASSENFLKDFIIGQGLSLKNIEYLLRLSKDERKGIIKAFTSMRTTESYIREILEMLLLMKIKTGRFPYRTVGRAESAGELRLKLKKRLYPGLLSLEKKLEKEKAALGLPPAIDIKVDPFFEKEYIDITIRVKSGQEAEGLLQKLNEVLKKGHIGNILELTKGRIR
ncbi:MAG TPA: ParB/RepB/Spo0J family partition protein [Syntrophorhabdaceae bacterium]|nr:ParB/RepB/Spo0J family partition protein [Syntrophorhabdaceae bacterium]